MAKKSELKFLDASARKFVRKVFAEVEAKQKARANSIRRILRPKSKYVFQALTIGEMQKLCKPKLPWMSQKDGPELFRFTLSYMYREKMLRLNVMSFTGKELMFYVV